MDWLRQESGVTEVEKSSEGEQQTKIKAGQGNRAGERGRAGEERTKTRKSKKKKQFKSFQNLKVRCLIGRVVTTEETTTNWQRVERVTKYLSSSKGRIQSM